MILLRSNNFFLHQNRINFPFSGLSYFKFWVYLLLLLLLILALCWWRKSAQYLRFLCSVQMRMSRARERGSFRLMFSVSQIININQLMLHYVYSIPPWSITFLTNGFCKRERRSVYVYARLCGTSSMVSLCVILCRRVCLCYFLHGV